MTTSLAWNLLDRLNPARLAGPIFDKELRVSSRQRRSYWLRFGYIALLLAVMVYFWLVVVRTQQTGSAVVQISRMSEAGKQAVTVIVWFQFVTGQLLALALLGGAIGSEIRQRSLDVLFVTPITSSQIVIGKFLSKLLQIGSLLAASLPLLASLRVFGGVPWDYVVACLCVTATAVLFVGAVSLVISISQHQIQQAFSGAFSLCLLFWLALYAVPALLAYRDWIDPALPRAMARLTIPFVVMSDLTRSMLSGGGGGIWPRHCLFMLGATVVLLLYAIWRVRRTAMVRIVVRQAGQTAGTAKGTSHWPWRRSVRRVTGSPIAWKETRRPLFARGRGGWLGFAVRGILVAAVAVTLVVTFVISPDSRSPIALGVGYLFSLVFFLSTTTSAASAIPREKEARTWPILLTTPLGDGEIVRGKAVGILRRNLPLLIPVPFLIALAPLMNDNALPINGSVVTFFLGWLFRTAGSLVFLIGMALLLGVCVKTTTSAVVATFAIYLVSRMVLPVAVLLTIGRTGGPGVMVVGGLVQGFVYAAIGIAALCGATRRVRRNIFA